MTRATKAPAKGRQPSEAPSRAASGSGLKPAQRPACDIEVNRYIAAYIMGLANRLGNGASIYYRRHYNLGMSEWRAMMAIGTSTHRIVREVAEMADLDYAAASKSLRLLQQRGLADVVQTQRRGRAAIASLTDEGLALYRQLCTSSRQRQQRLLAPFEPKEVDTLWALLRRLEAGIAHMNAEP
jgi:DNA-binding MarR family transcriptional regulator